MEQISRQVLAIICAKKVSQRFSGKNRIGFSNVLNECLSSEKISHIVVASDDEEILNEAAQKSKTTILYRNRNAVVPEDSMYDIAKWAYLSLNKSYEAVAVLMPNTLNTNKEGIEKSIDMLFDKNLCEVRTYGEDGCENGVAVMETEYFKQGNFSVYCGAIITDGRELNYKEDMN